MLFRSARKAFLDVVDFMATQSKAAPNAVYGGSVPYLMLAGNLVAGWQLARALMVAEDRLAAGEDAAFMQAKIATCRFYAEHILNKAPGLRDSIVAGAEAVVDLAARGHEMALHGHAHFPAPTMPPSAFAADLAANRAALRRLVPGPGYEPAQRRAVCGKIRGESARRHGGSREVRMAMQRHFMAARREIDDGLGAGDDAVAQSRCLVEDVLGVEAAGGDLGLHEGGVLARGQAVFGNHQRARQLPARDQVARQHQVGHRTAVHRVGRGLGLRGHEVHHVQEGLAGRSEEHTSELQSQR